MEKGSLCLNQCLDNTKRWNYTYLNVGTWVAMDSQVSDLKAVVAVVTKRVTGSVVWTGKINLGG